MPPSSHSWIRAREPLAAKVPEITAMFWVVKILTTGMGEAAADFLAHISLVLAAGIGVVGFVAGLALQFRASRYTAPVYWFAVMMVAVFGTMAADGPPVGHLGSMLFYIAVLAGVLYYWYRSEGTLSIHSIVTRRRETLYWLTVVTTFALGTAAGDVTADTLHLGYLGSGLLFAVAILVPLIGWRFGLNEVVAFWLAYILTRPLGASFADWLGKPSSKSGVGLGDGVVAAAATVLIVALVVYLAVTRGDIQRPATPEPHRPEHGVPAHDFPAFGGPSFADPSATVPLATVPRSRPGPVPSE
ncbi:protein of unknown function DUF347 [Parafrankia sp. EAN1pec]|uniref:COG4705 family protein n=1 Tax=Parafrankia sp. (strain EAN1pec) TaxID=298653 RepID=UPI00015D9F25|nr:protein of unknown function DUF347 [Frankia sp. EAN1pec]